MEYANAKDNSRVYAQLTNDMNSAISTFKTGNITNKLHNIPILCNILHHLSIVHKAKDAPAFIDRNFLESNVDKLLEIIKTDFKNPVLTTAMMNSWYLYCHSDMLGDIISHFIGLLDSEESILWTIKSMLRGLFMHAMKLDRTLLPLVTPVMVRELQVDGQEVMRQIKAVGRQKALTNQIYIKPDQINHKFPNLEEGLQIQQITSRLPLVVMNKVVMDVLKDTSEEKFQGILQKALKDNILEQFINHYKSDFVPIDPRVRYEENDQNLDIFNELEIDNKDALEVLLEEILSYSEYFTDNEMEVWKNISSYIYGQQLTHSDTSIIHKLTDQVHVLLKIAYFLHYKKNDLYEDFVHVVVNINIKNAVKFISELPLLSDETMALIGKASKEEFDVISLLQEIINFKPMQRFKALDYLLECCVSDSIFIINLDKVMRAQSVSICKSFAQRDVVLKIKEFAIQQFKLVDFKDPDNVPKHIELFLSMLIKDSSYFNEFIAVYMQIENKQELTKVLLVYMQQLEDYDALLSQVQGYAKKCPELVLEIVQRLSNEPSINLLKMAKDLVDDKFTPKILMPVLYAFDKSDLLKYLPYIFNDEDEQFSVKTCLMKVLMTIGEDNAHKLTPSELLVLVHKSESVLKDKTAALADVLDLSDVQTEPILTAALKELMTLDKIPELTMITVQYCIENHEKMIKFITNELMAIMVRKTIWNSPGLWHSFKYLCEITQPQCFGVVLDLPLAPFKELINDKPIIKDKLKNLISNSTHLRHSRRIRPLLPILEATT